LLLQYLKDRGIHFMLLLTYPLPLLQMQWSLAIDQRLRNQVMRMGKKMLNRKSRHGEKNQPGVLVEGLATVVVMQQKPDDWQRRQLLQLLVSLLLIMLDLIQLLCLPWLVPMSAKRGLQLWRRLHVLMGQARLPDR